MGLVESRALSQQINDLLLEWIAGGELKPGQRLTEIELASQLGVSRTPVREALKTLSASGFVTIVPRRGVFVAEVDIERLEEVVDLRYILEMYAAEKGAERISKQQLEKMIGLLEGCESIVRSTDRRGYAEYAKRDIELHRLIVESSGNRTLVRLHEGLAAHLDIVRARVLEGRPSVEKSHAEHRAIVDSYASGDKHRVLEAVERHLQRSNDHILRVAREWMGAQGEGGDQP